MKTNCSARLAVVLGLAAAMLPPAGFGQTAHRDTRTAPPLVPTALPVVRQAPWEVASGLGLLVGADFLTAFDSSDLDMGYGVDLAARLAAGDRMALELGVRYTNIQVEDDATLVADDFGVTALRIGPRVPLVEDVAFGLAVTPSIAYAFVNGETLEGESYEDAVLAGVDLSLVLQASGEFGLELGLGYQFDLVKSEAGEEELPLAGLRVECGLLLRF